MSKRQPYLVSIKGYLMATKGSCREIGKVLKFWIFWILIFLPLTLAIRSSVLGHNLELMNHLKKLNKPHVKSIKSPDGDIIDCILINYQPAFDHPFLKNHTIQMQPSFYPEEVSSKPSSHEEPLTQLWQTNGRCPKGTIPIRRTNEEDLLRASSFQSFGKKTPHTIPNPYAPHSRQTNGVSHEYVVRYVDKGKIYGAKARINLWNPRVQEDGEFSLAQIWVVAGDYDVDLNTVEVGWQVCSQIYGDNRTRIFVYWTRDSYGKTGCYNLLCSGFVQISRKIVLGGSWYPISSYNGDQYEMSTLIWKDPNSGNWWLQVQNTSVGYWPSTLFTHLQDVASTIEWGGEVVNKGVGGKHTTTEMGSGRFSGDRFKKAAFFRKLQTVDESNVLRTAVKVKTKVTKSDCYDLSDGKSDNWGEYFYFGGPGRNRDCV